MLSENIQKENEKELQNDTPLIRNDSLRTIIILCIIMAISIFGGLYNVIYNYLALIIAFVAIFFSRPKTGMVYLVFLLPFASIFKVDANSISLFSIVLLFAIAKMLYCTLKYEYKIKGILYIVLLSAYLAYSRNNINSGRMLNIIAGFIFIYLYLIIISREGNLLRDLKDLVFLFSLGIILSSFLSFFSDNIPNLQLQLRNSNIKMGNGIYYNRFSGLIGNPNYYSMDLIIVLSCLLFLLWKKEIKISFYIFSALLISLGFLTASKSFLISLVFLIILYIMICFKNSLKSGWLNLIIIFIVTFLSIVLAGKDTINALMFRINSDFSVNATLSSITTHRIDNWKEYINFIKDNTKTFLLGEGINSTYLYNRATHNTFIQIWYNLGLIGGIIYLVSLIGVLKTEKLNIKRHLINYIPLYVLLLRGLAIDLLFFDNLYFYLVLIWFVYNIESERIISWKQKKN